jgi:hypothetical protein
MNECQIVGGFLFPPRHQAAGSVGPAMCSFHHPASRSSPLVTWFFVLAAFGYVRLVASALCDLLNRLADVAFVQAEMLSLPSVRTWPLDGDRVQGFRDQLLIVRVGARNRDAQRHAAGISENRSLDAEFSAIGRVFPGFFPHPAATWLSPRPNSAIAIRFLSADRTCGDRLSKVAGTRPASSIPESSDVPCWASRIRAVAPSTDSLYVADKKFRRPRPANSRAAAHLYYLCDTSAAPAASAAIIFPESAKTCSANPVAYPPPCKDPDVSSSGTTHKVNLCSVLG